MELSEYLRDRESVLCQTKAMLEDGLDIDSGGDLACTDTRLVYTNGEEITDIRLGGISEIITIPSTYLNKFAQWAFFSLMAALFAWSIMPDIPEVAEFAEPATYLLIFTT